MPKSARSEPAASAARPTDQVLIEQVKLLHGAAFAIPVNGLAALVVTAVLWDSIPSAFLIVWVATSWLVVALRLALRKWFKAGNGRDAVVHARLFTAGAAASGL